jgi:coenzyme F420-reducing hydrogenase gamma subunit
VLGLSPVLQSRVVQALESQRRPSVIWLQLQECTGCVESVIRTDSPTIGDLLLDVISLDYQHTLMAAAGSAAESAREQSMRENHGKYLLVVTGSIPLADDGIYTTIGGRTVKSILEEAAAGAAAVIAVGACAHWGNIQAARPNPTGAVGVSHVVRDKPVVNIAGCPPIADVITATIVHYLTFQRIPALADGAAVSHGAHRPVPAARADAGQYVEVFDTRPRALVPVQGRLQGTGDLLALPHHPVERRDLLAHRRGASVHRLHGAQLLGHDVPVLPPDAGSARLRRRAHRRHGRPGAGRGRDRRRRRARTRHRRAPRA